jgi:hypothetical protein
MRGATMSKGFAQKVGGSRKFPSSDEEGWRESAGVVLTHKIVFIERTTRRFLYASPYRARASRRQPSLIKEGSSKTVKAFQHFVHMRAMPVYAVALRTDGKSVMGQINIRWNSFEDGFLVRLFQLHVAHQAA